MGRLSPELYGGFRNWGTRIRRESYYLGSVLGLPIFVHPPICKLCKVTVAIKSKP